jgi:energy-coupling factor transporter ATP-binding protein EcfA2
MSVKITSIKFTNFKSFKNYSISLEETNILVGPNNAGKSTIISSLRILEVALKRAKSKNPERIHLPEEHLGYGHHISIAQLGISLENVATDYNSEDSKIEFKLSNNNRLILFFPNDGGCTLYWQVNGQPVITASRFRTEFPISIQVIPVLGPLEHNESIVTIDTVKESLNSHRASRHFRNYWSYFPDGWERFSDMIEKTWPGMSVKPPESDLRNHQLTMFVSEDRIDREIYWAGFGFQIWCQLLTHISRASDATLLAIDEPEIYLHPDVQRQLLGILRDLPTDILIATHSVEIIGEADPAEILIIQKNKLAAQRIRDVEGIQLALNSIGSAQNVTLAHLARTKKIIFVEGNDDYKTLRRFAKVMGFIEISTGNDLTAFESGGFTSWEKVKSFAWGVKKTIDANIKIFAVYDRDYYCDEQINQTEIELKKELSDAYILKRKEMENYLLNIDVLQRVMEKQLAHKNKRTGTVTNPSKTIAEYLTAITDAERIDAQSQYVSKRMAHFRGSSLDTSTLSKQAIQAFENSWNNIQTRMAIVPGKTVLRSLRDQIQSDLGINLTDFQIIDEFNEVEIPEDLKELIQKLELFRSQ